MHIQYFYYMQSNKYIQPAQGLISKICLTLCLKIKTVSRPVNVKNSRRHILAIILGIKPICENYLYTTLIDLAEEMNLLVSFLSS